MEDEDGPEDKQKKRSIRLHRNTNLSVATIPLFVHLHGLHPGEAFWRWVAPGDEHRFESKFFQENYYDIPLTIAEDLDRALIGWLEGIPPVEIREKLDHVIDDVRCLPDQDKHRPLKPSAIIDPDDLEDVSFKNMLLGNLSDFRELVVEESTRQHVIQTVGNLRNILYPNISGPGTDGKPIGRG